MLFRSDVSQYRALDLPIVGFDRILGPDIPCVAADHEAGGRMAAEVLLECGCKNVLQFMGANHNGGQQEAWPKDWVITPADQRHIVFQQIMEAHGVQCRCVLEQNLFLSPDHARRIAEAAFQTYPEVDGVFGADLFAMACHHYALEHGKQIPQNLKIVSYDGTNATQFMTPSLTTVCQPFQELAEASVHLILQLIQGKPAEEKRLTLPVTLRLGQSTGPA